MRTLEKQATNRLSTSIHSIDIYPSRYWLGGIVLLHGMACIAVFVSDLPWYVRLILGAWVLFCVAIAGFHWHSQPVYQVCSQHNSWYLIGHQPSSSRYRIKSCYFWSTFLLMLWVQNTSGQTRLFPVVLDSCSREHFRWLRVTVNMINPDHLDS